MDVSTSFFLLLKLALLSSFSCSLPLFQGKGWGRGNFFLLFFLLSSFSCSLPLFQGKGRGRGNFFLLFFLLFLAPCPCFRGRAGEGVTSSCSYSFIFWYSSLYAICQGADAVLRTQKLRSPHIWGMFTLVSMPSVPMDIKIKSHEKWFLKYSASS